jgi:tRNA (pseudouridine54-N1)-methyltransferase
VSIRTGDFGDLLGELKKKITYLREDGADIRQNPLDKDPDHLFVLGDHMGLTDDEEAVVKAHEYEIISVGPRSLHAEHCIVLLHNEMDRSEGSVKS